MSENRQTERTLDALLERARGIAQLAAARTQAIDQQRRLPDDLITAIEESDLFRVMQPSRKGLMLRCADEIMSLPADRRIPTEQERMRYYACAAILCGSPFVLWIA